mmetsp:Transcript_2018/g.8903  ORF Transcript_2018/g.8903 Transcript_2018/m.8903 type:complete len:110 (-) Transcript_2018:824-1153(-)
MATQLCRAQMWQRCHFKKPILALFGDQDLLLDVQSSDEAHSFVKRVFPGSQQVEADIVRGAGRFLMETHSSAVIGRLWRFVVSRAKDKEASSPAALQSKAKQRAAGHCK